MKKKVILSTGIGPLHLIKSAIYLSKFVDIRVIQSWIPKNANSTFVSILSKIIGHKYLAIGLKKRTPIELEGKNFSCSTPDFLLWGLKAFTQKIGISADKKIAGWAWVLFGSVSKKYINNADIFHVRSGAGQGGAILKAKKENMKIIVDHSIAHPAYMDKYLKGEFEKNNHDFNLGMESPLFQYTVEDAKMADVVLVNSFFVKKTFVEQGFDENKLKVVYLGVSDDFLMLKKEYSINKKVKLLFTGGFGFRKGGEYLLKALQRLEYEGFDFEMNIVGTFKEATDLIKKYPVKSVNFIGFIPQENLKKFLKEADMYVFPSLCEGCASSGMEAMAAGLPMISTEESGFPIVHNEDGIIIPAKDYMAIYSAIKMLALDQNKRELIGRNAMFKISKDYTWDAYAKNVNQIYNEIIIDNGISKE